MPDLPEPARLIFSCSPGYSDAVPVLHVRLEWDGAADSTRRVPPAWDLDFTTPYPGKGPHRAIFSTHHNPEQRRRVNVKAYGLLLLAAIRAKQPRPESITTADLDTLPGWNEQETSNSRSTTLGQHLRKRPLIARLLAKDSDACYRLRPDIEVVVTDIASALAWLGWTADDSWCAQRPSPREPALLSPDAAKSSDSHDAEVTTDAASIAVDAPSSHSSTAPVASDSPMAGHEVTTNGSPAPVLRVDSPPTPTNRDYEPGSVIVASDGSGHFASLAQAVAESPAGSRIILIEGCYQEGDRYQPIRIDKPLTIIGRTPGGAVTIQTLGGTCIEIAAAPVTLRNLRIRTRGTPSSEALNNQVAVVIDDRNSALRGELNIEQCEIISETGGALRLSGRHLVVSVTDCRLPHCTGDALTILGVQGVIERCLIESPARRGVVVNGSSIRLSTLRILHAGAVGMSLGGAPTVEGCEVAHSADAGIEVLKDGTATILGSKIRDNDGPGIRLDFGASAAVSTSDVIGNHAGILLPIWSTSLRLDGCTIKANKTDGIRLKNGRAFITGSSICENHGSGVHVGTVDTALTEDHFHFFRCDILNNRGSGLLLTGKATPELVLCSIRNNAGGDIRKDGGSKHQY